MGRKSSVRTPHKVNLDDNVVVLEDEEGLNNVDVEPALKAFKLCSQWPNSELETRFKRNETLGSVAKSVLKHRIKLLTGRNPTDLESRLGYSIRDGRTMSVAETRKLAHFLILQANDALDKKSQASLSDDSVQEDIQSVRKRKRGNMNKIDDEMEEESNETSIASTSKTPRTRNSTPRVATPLVRRSLSRQSLNRNSSIGVDAIEEEEQQEVEIQEKRVSKRARVHLEALQEEKMEDQTGMDNPTPQMAALKASRTRQQQKITKVQVVEADEGPAAKRSTRMRPEKTTLARSSTLSKGFPGVLIQNTDVEQEQNYVYLTRVSEAYTSLPALGAIKSVMDDSCPGFYLTVIEPPASWDASQVFSLVQSVRSMNRTLKMDSFLVLVKCDVANIKLIQEALLTQTRHVQCGVLEVKSSAGQQHKLSETAGLFLIGYFFPGCNENDSVPRSWMVREGSSTVLSAENEEALENLIVGTLTLPGHCLLEIHCGESELCLAAQKTGRSALVINGRKEHLESLQTKADAIARFHHGAFVGAVIHTL